MVTSLRRGVARHFSTSRAAVLEGCAALSPRRKVTNNLLNTSLLKKMHQQSVVLTPDTAHRQMSVCCIRFTTRQVIVSAG